MTIKQFETEQEKKWGYLETPTFMRKEEMSCDECGDDEASENEPTEDYPLGGTLEPYDLRGDR